MSVGPKREQMAKTPFFAILTPPKRLFPVNYLVKRYFFLWTTLPGRGRNMVRVKKWVFLGQNFRILARKSVFCYRTPDFVNGPFVALAKAVDLAPSDPFLNFSFPSYGRFREGDPPTQQKVLPHLTVGALTDSNSPCALRALALRARALRARAGKKLTPGPK